jgi:hypothetical protein
MEVINAYSETGITKDEYESAIAALHKYEADVEKTMTEKKKEKKNQTTKNAEPKKN